MADEAKAAQAKAAGTGCLVVIVLGGVLGLAAMCGGGGADDAPPEDPDFACLSSWDGSFVALADWVAPQLRDPRSFQHVETRVTDIVALRQTVYMDFRAANGFGGLNAGRAAGEIVHPDCVLENPVMLTE